MNANKGTAWAEQGCAVALADMNDADALKAAFADAEGVFVLIPPNFAPARGFPETRAIVAALHTAIASSRPGKVVCLSTIGAQATQMNLLTPEGVDVFWSVSFFLWHAGLEFGIFYYLRYC